VVRALNCDKALVPYGFTMAFFQACWEVLKVDRMNVFNDFHARSMFEKCLNATFIDLILKKSGAIDIKDFRPISLVG
jgi:undecaprenyl pyrophosphate synthase